MKNPKVKKKTSNKSKSKTKAKAKSKTKAKVKTPTKTEAKKKTPNKSNWEREDILDQLDPLLKVLDLVKSLKIPLPKEQAIDLLLGYLNTHGILEHPELWSQHKSLFQDLEVSHEEAIHKTEEWLSWDKYGDFRFKAPNWRNEEEYKHLNPETTSPEEWAWEFRRRNEKYQRDSKTCFEAKQYLEKNVTKEEIDSAVEKDDKELKRVMLAANKDKGTRSLAEIMLDYIKKNQVDYPELNFEKYSEELRKKDFRDPPTTAINTIIATIKTKVDKTGGDFKELYEKFMKEYYSQSHTQINQSEALEDLRKYNYKKNEIVENFRTIQNLLLDWRVEEKSPNPEHLKIIPNPNTKFENIELTQCLKAGIGLDGPKIVDKMERKVSIDDPRTYLPKIFIEVSPLKSVGSNIKQIKILLEKEREKYKYFRESVDEGERPRPAVWPEYLRLIDGKREGVSQSEMGKTIYPHIEEEQLNSKVSKNLKNAKELLDKSLPTSLTGSSLILSLI
jgi:hypothetical protein